MDPSEPTSRELAQGQESSVSGRFGQTSGRLSRVVASIVVALVVVFFALLALQRGNSPASPPAPSVPTTWQTYHDPARLFSLRIPQGWIAELSTGAESFGDRTGSASETNESLVVRDPAQGGGSARFYVSASPIHTAFERQWYCQAFSGTHAAFHGIPASALDNAMWLFDTANAHFHLDVAIPGVLEPPHSSPIMPPSVPTATPLPASTVAVDRRTLATMLSSFQPSDPRALACA